MSQVPPGYSNYYRPGQGGGGPYNPGTGKPNLDAIGPAWQLVTKNLGIWIPANLIYVVVIGGMAAPIEIAARGMSGFNPGMPGAGFGISNILTYYAVSLSANVIQQAIQFVLIGGMMHMALKLADGEVASIGDMFAGFNKLGSMLSGGLIYGILLILGIICCFIPGIYIAGALAFLPLMLLRQDVSPVDGVKKCFEIMKQDAWMMFLVILVAGLIAIAGFIACCVGILVTFAMYPTMVALNYRGYFPNQPLEPAMPTGPMGPSAPFAP